MAASRSALSGGTFTTTLHSTTYAYISPLTLDLSGAHVLITGAAHETGVGYATATAFARAGASAIALADIHDIPLALATKLQNASIDAGRASPRSPALHSRHIAARQRAGFARYRSASLPRPAGYRSQ